MGKSVDTFIFLGRLCSDEEEKLIKDSIDEDGDELSWDSKKPYVIDGLSVFKHLFMEGLDYEYYLIQQKICALYDDEADGEVTFDIAKLEKPRDSRFRMYIVRFGSAQTPASLCCASIARR
jgi:hypothetical protein